MKLYIDEIEYIDNNNYIYVDGRMKNKIANGKNIDYKLTAFQEHFLISLNG